MSFFQRRSTFKYKKLRSTGEIRLLVIEAGAANDELKCRTVDNEPLDQNIAYDALSYRWGEEFPQLSIKVNGCAVSVRPALHAALKALRNADGGRTVWIDALCINQNDTKEKECQVSLMREIYHNAQQTVVWLGPEADESNLAMDFIIYQASREPARAHQKMEHRWIGWTTQDDYFYIVRDPKFTPVWDAVFALCARDYWSRMWIIQELVLSKDPVIWCGSRRVKWADFELVLGSIYAMINDRVPGATYFLHLLPLRQDSFPLILDQQRRERLGQSPPRDQRWLATTLQRYRRFEASEERDKIYALLGLVDDDYTRNAVKVDYSRSLRKVYTDILKFLVPRRRLAEPLNQIITGRAPTTSVSIALDANGNEISGAVADSGSMGSRAHGPLNILCSAGYSSSKQHNFPSWLPDWSDNQLTSTIDDTTHNRFTASADTEPIYSFHRFDTVLEVHGYCLSILQSIGAPTLTNELIPLIDVVESWLATAFSNTIFNFAQRQGAFWKTLVLDSFPTHFYFEAPDEWEQMSVSALEGFFTGRELSGQEESLLPSEYLLMLEKVTATGRRFSVAKDGAFLMVPDEARVGDMVCVLWGCDIPVIIGTRNGQHVLIGECYCDLLMDGTWTEALKQTGIDPKDLTTIFHLR
ncbi:Heterokaryon incompatibility protein [Paramyrothecium foliicola]|nr:Heterokaryon incompatibility protein [Paramyrothecium foliicola]